MSARRSWTHLFTFGDVPIILVGDLGQLQAIEDWIMCDTEATFQKCPASQSSHCRSWSPTFAKQRTVISWRGGGTVFKHNTRRLLSEESFPSVSG